MKTIMIGGAFLAGAALMGLLGGCQNINLEESIGVDATDNAVICASVNVDPTWSESAALYRRIELPQGYVVTPEQLAELLAACP